MKQQRSSSFHAELESEACRQGCQVSAKFPLETSPKQAQKISGFGKGVHILQGGDVHLCWVSKQIQIQIVALRSPPNL